MGAATIRFHGELRDLLPPRERAPATIQAEIKEGRSVKDAIEAAGVPHTEIDLIVANASPVGFDYPLCPGDRIDVYGLDRPPELVGLPGLTPVTPAPPAFLADGHLGRLARYLRLLGFDVRYDRTASDASLAHESLAEDRILLTRDRGLLKRGSVRLGYLVREDDPQAQLGSVVRRFDLGPLATPFTRCVHCNGAIRAVPQESVLDELAGEPKTLRYFHEFGRCGACGKVYWAGSHFERMREIVERVAARPSKLESPRDV